MPAEPAAIAAHAETLRSDARALADCAERLRAIEARLEEEGVAPHWLRASIQAHLTACTTAATDLATAAAHLRRCAERTAG